MYPFVCHSSAVQIWLANYSENYHNLWVMGLDNIQCFHRHCPVWCGRIWFDKPFKLMPVKPNKMMKMFILFMSFLSSHLHKVEELTDQAVAGDGMDRWRFDLGPFFMLIETVLDSFLAPGVISPTSCTVVTWLIMANRPIGFFTTLSTCVTLFSGNYIHVPFCHLFYNHFQGPAIYCDVLSWFNLAQHFALVWVKFHLPTFQEFLDPIVILDTHHWSLNHQYSCHLQTY